MRNNFYDSIPESIETIKKSLAIRNKDADTFNKSKDFDDSSELKRFAKSYQITDQLGKKLFNQFSMLKSDFDAGQINSARYRDNLKPLHNLLTSQKVDVLGLNTPLIANELKKMGFN